MDIDAVAQLSLVANGSGGDAAALENLLRALEEAKKKQKEARERAKSELSSMFAKLRDKAVSARKNSGFEKQWQEDEEFYIGVDDLNRGDELRTYQIRGNAPDITLVDTAAGKKSSSTCTAFLNITAPFVDAAAARVADINLPANDWNFGIRPTPIPEFESIETTSQTATLLDANGRPLPTVADMATEKKKAADKHAKKADNRIRDWLTQCNYKEECRKVIDSGALVGVGILKGPCPTKRKSTAFSNGELIEHSSIDPESYRVDHWNFYPDMNCGENIQDGDYVFEHAELYARVLVDLKDQPGYDAEAIDQVIAEGPKKRNVGSAKATPTEDDDRFEVWYCYKYITADELRLLDEEFDEQCRCNVDENGDEKPVDMSPFMAWVMLVNDTVIYAAKWPLENSGFPFSLFVWQRVPNQPFGIGVARQGRTAQKTVLAAYRNLMENQGLSAKPMLAFLTEALEPLDKSWELYGGKKWKIRRDKATDIRQALQFIEIPSRQEDLAALIQFGMKAMEDATGITFLLQGAAPDTVGGMQMMLQSSATLLRRITRGYDKLTENHIRGFYDWLLLYGKDDEKGDFQIEATGSSALLEREIQSMQLPQLLQFAMNPQSELSFKKTLQEILKAWRFDPAKFEMDETEKQEAQQRAQQVQDPRLVAAQFKSQTDLKIANTRAEVEMQKIKKDMDRDALFAQGVTERTQITYQAHIEELQLKRDLAMLEYANREKTNLDSIKAKLAAGAALSDADHRVLAKCGPKTLAFIGYEPKVTLS